MVCPTTLNVTVLPQMSSLVSAIIHLVRRLGGGDIAVLGNVLGVLIDRATAFFECLPYVLEAI